MSIHRLAPRKVQTARPVEYEDGGGLRLVVSEAGAKKWVVRFTLDGRRREMGLGGFQDVGLAEARERARACRQQVAAGIDPIMVRSQATVIIPTFTTCAAMYVRSRRRGWKNAKHARQWVRTLKTYARSHIGEKAVDRVGTEDVLEILAPIWTTKSETAKRVPGRIGNILDFAAAPKYRDPVNPARWRGHLDKLLPKPTRVKKVTHHPAMPYEDVPAFMAELARNDSRLARAVAVHDPDCGHRREHAAIAAV